MKDIYYIKIWDKKDNYFFINYVKKKNLKIKFKKKKKI